MGFSTGFDMGIYQKLLIATVVAFKSCPPFKLGMGQLVLDPSTLDLNQDIYVNYAYWVGGPLALSLGCCQELYRKLAYWSNLRGTVF